MATTVVQLYSTKQPLHNEWIKVHTGILVLTKDFLRKDYFFRIFCLGSQRKIWEHGVYNQMEYLAPKPYLHVFEGESCMFGFNFANVDEATQFRFYVSRAQEMVNKKYRTATKENETLPTGTLQYNSK